MKFIELPYTDSAFISELTDFCKSKNKNTQPILFKILLEDFIQSGHLPPDIFLAISRDYLYEDNLDGLCAVLEKNPQLLKDAVIQEYIDTVLSKEFVSAEEKDIFFQKRARFLSLDALTKMDPLFRVQKPFKDLKGHWQDPNPDSFLNTLRKHITLEDNGVYSFKETSPDTFHWRDDIPHMLRGGRGIVQFCLVISSHWIIYLHYNVNFRRLVIHSYNTEMFISTQDYFLTFDIRQIFKRTKRNKELCQGLAILDRITDHKFQKGVQNSHDNNNYYNNQTSKLLKAFAYGEALLLEEGR